MHLLASPVVPDSYRALAHSAQTLCVEPRGTPTLDDKLA